MNQLSLMGSRTAAWGFASDPWALRAHEQKPNIQAQTITQAKVPTIHEDKKLLWYWHWQAFLPYGIFFDETRNTKNETAVSFFMLN